MELSSTIVGDRQVSSITFCFEGCAWGVFVGVATPDTIAVAGDYGVNLGVIEVIFRSRSSEENIFLAEEIAWVCLAGSTSLFDWIEWKIF